MSKQSKDGLNRREVLGSGLTVATIAGTSGLAAGGAGALTLAGTRAARADEAGEQDQCASR